MLVLGFSDDDEAVLDVLIVLNKSLVIYYLRFSTLLVQTDRREVASAGLRWLWFNFRRDFPSSGC